MLELIQTFGWEPILFMALLVFALLFPVIVVIALVAVTHSVSIRTPIFTLTIGNPALRQQTRRTYRRASPIGTELKNLRVARRIKLGELAKLLNVTVAFISGVEGGTEELSADQLERIIVEFGLIGLQAAKLRDALRHSSPKGNEK